MSSSDTDPTDTTNTHSSAKRSDTSSETTTDSFDTRTTCLSKLYNSFMC